jgi:hypothetical protein
MGMFIATARAVPFLIARGLMNEQEEGNINNY